MVNMISAAGLTGIGTEPYFGIGQRAILVQTPEGALMASSSALATSEPYVHGARPSVCQ